MTSMNEQQENTSVKNRFSFKKFLLWSFFFFLFCAILGTGAIFTLLYWASRDLPTISKIADYNPPQATTVLAANGEVLGILCHEKRFLITLEEMSKYLPLAFLAAEDDSFYTHHGVDPIAILRAAINNFRKGRPGEGGSTITQQLIKQLLLTSERSYTRKMKEAILAYQLEKDLSKKDILTIYLNQIFLGEKSYGVEAAARTYFGKHASDLTLAECAVIAGLPKAPTRYNPYKSPQSAKERQMYVLGRLKDLNWITPEEYSRAVIEPLVYWSAPEGMSGPALWYMEEARRLLIEFFTEANLKALGVQTEKSGEDYVYEAGLTVQTAMSPVQQLAAGQALARGLEELDKRQGWRGPVYRKDKAYILSFLKNSKFIPQDLAGDGWVQAVVKDVNAKEASLDLGNGYTGTIAVSQIGWARTPNPKIAAANAPSIKDVRKVLEPDDIVWVSIALPGHGKNKNIDSAPEFDPINYKPGIPIPLKLQQVPEVQGALASLEPQTGNVVALIGGYNFEESQFNRATQARRQPGSSFKPIVYSAALDLGFTPASIILDAPLVYINPYTNEVWRPSNYEHNFKGPLPLWQALALSRNTCTVRVAQVIGIDNVIARAKALGLEPNFPRELAISLGAVDVSPLNLTQAYAAFANQGLGVRPRIITQIRDAQDKILYDQPPEHWQALTPQNAFMMATLLKNVVNAGTGSRAKIDGRVIAGKTGTTNGEHDAWFIGFSPSLVTGVFVGFDHLRSLGRLEQGGRTAAPIFKYYRSQIEHLYEPRDFEMPDNIIMSGNFAYRADQPLEGVSATDGYADDNEEKEIDDDEVMRQMF